MDELVERYRRYLLIERGLTAGTARGYVDLVRPFIESRSDPAGGLRLWDLTAADVLGFVLSQTDWRSRKSAKLLVSALRSLSQNRQFLGEPGEQFRCLSGACVRHNQRVLDADAAAIGQIDAGLHRNHGARK